METQREQFEAWLKTKPEALYWNASDAMFATWCGAVEAAARRLEEEAKYGRPCNEDERVTWENADMLREWAGLPKRDTETPNAQ